MVAKIKSGKSLIGALNYNENKVKQEKAQLIAAVGYYRELPELNFYDKLFRLTDLAGRNERTKTNTVHISLNFANGENLPDETLRAIVKDYMAGIGFENQPYLVYRHEDAGHPHIHIVSTNIKKDGERISLHYLGQNQSEKIRKAIEVKYSLTKAEEQIRRKPTLKADLPPAEYGKTETKRAITNILGYVLRSYKFTGVPELNAVLRKYNVMADRGSKESRMYAKSGLVYWILDKHGNKVGVPVKASSIYGKPTLKSLDEKFRLNETLRKPLKAGMIKSIDEVLQKPRTKSSFLKALQEKGIQVLFRQNDEGRLYGITFIDQRHHAVFNGSDLGKAYSANALSAKFVPELIQNNITKAQKSIGENKTESPGPAIANPGLLAGLLRQEDQDLAALHKFKKKKRKGLNI